MTSSRRITAIVSLCLASQTIGAPPGQLLQNACAESDGVVLGTVEPVVLSTASAVFTLTVDGVIKGPLTEKSAVTVSWPGSLTAARMSPSHYRALWFLRSKPSVGWEIMPVGGPNAPLYASGLALVPSAKGLASPSGLRCYEAVWAAVKESAAFIDQSPVYFTAMETLLHEAPVSNVSLPDFAATVEGFARSPSVELKRLALASGIRRQDVQSLIQVAAEARSITKSRATATASLAILGWRGSDPAGLAALGSIATQADAGLGSSAAEALMMIHTKDAAPHLAKLLAKPDSQMRNVAIRGLSLFVKGAPILDGPNIRAMAYLAEGQTSEYIDEKISPYITITPVAPDREDEYVKAWLDWWSRMAPKWPQ